MKKVILSSFFLASLIMVFQVEAKVGQDKNSWAPIVGQNSDSYSPRTGQRKDSYSPELGRDTASRPSKKTSKKSMKKTKKEHVKKMNEDVDNARWFDFDMN